MNTKNLMRIALAMIFGPPLCLALMYAGSLFMYLTEPWGWFLLFLVLALPFGTIVVGFIIRVGAKTWTGQFQPNVRHPGWGRRPAAGPTFRFKGDDDE